MRAFIGTSASSAELLQCQKLCHWTELGSTSTLLELQDAPQQCSVLSSVKFWAHFIWHLTHFSSSAMHQDKAIVSHGSKAALPTRGHRGDTTFVCLFHLKGWARDGKRWQGGVSGSTWDRKGRHDQNMLVAARTREMSYRVMQQSREYRGINCQSSILTDPSHVGRAWIRFSGASTSHRNKCRSSEPLTSFRPPVQVKQALYGQKSLPRCCSTNCQTAKLPNSNY